MRSKQIVFVALLIAMVALTQIQISPVLAYEKEETPLYPISGSDVDSRTLGGADGFAVAMTMDLPVDKMESTHARVAFAVGLADPWVYYDYPKYWHFTPYVKEMWVKVEGDGDYEPSPGAIVDNTGTGGSSTPDFWIALELVGALFTMYDIANFLMEVYQEPPKAEWEPIPQELHSVKAIVRQTGQPRYVPRLQTASIWFDSYFKRAGWNTLNITAEAESWVKVEFHDFETGFTYSYLVHSGTYRVSYEVSFVVGLPPETPSTPSGSTSGYVGTTYSYSTSTTDPDGDPVRYEFDWGDGSTTTTCWYISGFTATASHSWSSGTYYVKVRAQDWYWEYSGWSPYLTVNIVNRPPEGWVSPTGHEDPDNVWSGETNIYDDERTASVCPTPCGGWTSYIELLISPAIQCSGIRFQASFASSEDPNKQAQIDVYRDGGWVNVWDGYYQGYCGSHPWNEVEFSQGEVTRARLRFYQTNPFCWTVHTYLYEFDFWGY